MARRKYLLHEKFIVAVQISLLTVRVGVLNPRLHSLRLTVLRTAQPSKRIASEGRLAERHRAGYLKCPHKRQIHSNEIWTATMNFTVSVRRNAPSGEFIPPRLLSIFTR